MTRNIGFLLGLAAWLALPCAADAQNPQPAAPNEPHPPLASPSPDACEAPDPIDHRVGHSGLRIKKRMATRTRSAGR